MWKYMFSNNTQMSKSGYEFKMLYSFERRKEESTRLKEKYPDKIPTIIEKADTARIQKMEKHKFIFGKELTMGQILLIIRQKLKLDSTQTIFLFVDNRIIPLNDMTVGSLYERESDKDGFLYISYC